MNEQIRWGVWQRRIAAGRIRLSLEQIHHRCHPPLEISF
jgi:hypothetical protein